MLKFLFYQNIFKQRSSSQQFTERFKYGDKQWKNIAFDSVVFRLFEFILSFSHDSIDGVKSIA